MALAFWKSKSKKEPIKNEEPKTEEPRREEPEEEENVCILLIGSTGNGKSTLGNYLLDPHGHKPGGKHFETSKDNLPKTQKCKCVSKSIKVATKIASHDGTDISDAEVGTAEVGTAEVGTVDGVPVDGVPVDGAHGSDEDIKSTKKIIHTNLTVMDTPGLNENKERDLSHMIDLIETIHELKTIRACILVTKFSSKIDKQYKDTIKYYAKLLPSFFNNNVLVVMTDYATDERSVAIRKREGIDPEKFKSNVLREIAESAHISFTPMLFTIDCLPYGLEAADSEMVREALLSFILSRREVILEDLQLAKTVALVEEDGLQIKKFEGEISGYNLRLQQVNTHAKVALEEAEKQERNITHINTRLVKLNCELRELNSKDLITVKTWSIDDNSFRLWWRHRDFDIVSKWEIKNIETWTNGSCRFPLNLKAEGSRVRGRLKGNFNCRLYANLTLQTYKKLKFEPRIIELKIKIEENFNRLTEATSSAQENRCKHIAFEEDIKLLEGFICDRRQEITKLSEETLSLEEANSRLQKFRK